MDKTTHRLLRDVALHLTKAGVRTKIVAPENPVADHRQHDAFIALAYRQQEAEVRPVEIRTHVTTVTLGAIRAQLRAGPDAPILVTDYVTPPMADRLRDAGVQFADAAGNAYIEAKHFLVNIRGRRPREHRLGTRVIGRAFQPGGLRTIFVLLAIPDYVNRTYREIAKAARVAHGTVGWVMSDLKARGFLVEFETTIGPQKRRLTNIERLLPQWAEAYARVLRPKLVLACYRVENFDKWVTAPHLQPGMLAGGEIAAARLTHYLKPATATFWVDRPDPKFVLQNRLTLDDAGNVELMQRFWNLPETGAECAPDVLVYADLLHIGDARTLETANVLGARIHERLVGQG